MRSCKLGKEFWVLRSEPPRCKNHQLTFSNYYTSLYDHGNRGCLILKTNKLILTNILTDSGGRQKRRFAATSSRFFAKMRPPRVFWPIFGSSKRYARSYARYFKMAFGTPTRLRIAHPLVRLGSDLAYRGHHLIEHVCCLIGVALRPFLLSLSVACKIVRKCCIERITLYKSEFLVRAIQPGTVHLGSYQEVTASRYLHGILRRIR